MSSNLDFDSTKKYRDYILGRTLKSPNGPQTFTSSDYVVQNLSDYPNIDQDDVTVGRDRQLRKFQAVNLFKPDEYFIKEDFDNLPRRANLKLYPYFVMTDTRSLLGIIANDNYNNESELFKFASYNIKQNPEGPVFARVAQNLYSATVGRVRIIDALDNSTTAINILTGREPIIELNNRISVARSLPGKAIDFLQTVAGVEFPWVEIPGDYLTNPKRPVTYRPLAGTEGGRFIQDFTGALGSLAGIQRRPLPDRKPSDLFIEYMGEGQRQRLYDSLSYSKYGPNYTTTARSQNTSKVFNFVDNAAEDVKQFIGLEAPNSVSYIGDDRMNDVLYSMSDFNGNVVKSSFYLSIMYDPVQAELFEGQKNILEGSWVSGKLTWITSKSSTLNPLGVNNAMYGYDRNQLEDTFSIEHSFKDDSIMGRTQDILDSVPDLIGSRRSHVGNVIDQTTRLFREGRFRMSRGSAVKRYFDLSGEESGAEFCRVWTKDNPYLRNYNLIKSGGLIRKIDGSIFTAPYNINIYPNSDGNGSFKTSTNIKEGKNGFFAKKYMFSIENLAWKASNVPGFTYNDLPYCERGNNGGRVMWFPPYGLKVSEQNNADWTENVFIGRPEPIYTYNSARRNGSISFKVIVDHPSVLNLLVQKHFKNMTDEESTRYIDAFFSGCEEIDFYDLIRRYSTLDRDDIEKIKNYLNGNKEPDTILKIIPRVEAPIPEPVAPKADPPSVSGDNVNPKIEVKTINATLYYRNDFPKPRATSDIYSQSDYTTMYNAFMAHEPDYIKHLNEGLDKLFLPGGTWGTGRTNDYRMLYGEEVKSRPSDPVVTERKNQTSQIIVDGFDELEATYNKYVAQVDELKKDIKEKTVEKVRIQLQSSCSEPEQRDYNLKLSYRRSDCIIQDILKRITNDGATTPTFKWSNENPTGFINLINGGQIPPIPLKDLGYENNEGQVEFEFINNIGEIVVNGQINTHTNVDCTQTRFYFHELRETAPVTFYCRESTLAIKYETRTKPDEKEILNDGLRKDTPPPVLVKKPVPPKVLLEEYEEKIDNRNAARRPPLDEMKRIIMKVLAECYYFKQFEEDSPVAFSSLKEKLRYFHPAFHSMTPEGLNSRLTFLLQCLRPGDTIPIKGLSDERDLDARNTTFGPPPVCVLRVGDFYHSKVIIRDVNIEYEDDTWDLNPEGIGIQPMIANVTLQVSFLGGHGIEKPVERLQNALSFNFYGNTEVYDHRSIATNTMIGGKDAEQFTKEFLEDLVKRAENNVVPKDDPESSKTLTEGKYIGELIESGTTFSYTSLINDVFTNTTNYFNSYKDSVKTITGKYGNNISSIFFLSKYRTVKDYEVQMGGGGSYDIELLGQYPVSNDLSIISNNFGVLMKNKIKDPNTNLSNIMGIDDGMDTASVSKSNMLLLPYVTNTVDSIISSFTIEPAVKSVEDSRNKLTSNLDKLNYILKYNSDGKIKGTEAYSADITGFVHSYIYLKYYDCLKYITENNSKMTEGLDDTFDFGLKISEITNDLLSEFLSVLLKDKKFEILKLYENDKNFSDSMVKRIDKKLTKFLVSPTPIVVTLPSYPKPQYQYDVKYPLANPDVVISNATQKTDLVSVFSSYIKLGTTLNSYAP